MVRITLESSQKKAALISLMVAGFAACSVLAGYWVWYQDQEPFAVQRELPDVILRWRCPSGHVFEAPGAYEAKPCPTCRQPARIAITYLCTKDGPIEALVMYDSSSQRLSAVHFESGDWITVTNLVPCPRCGGELRPKQRGPFDHPASESGGNPPRAGASLP